MTETEHYDIVVFGGGKGGKTLAMDQASEGKRVALVEAGMVGGSCINIACIPTKALVRSAQLIDATRQTGVLGLAQTGPIRVDMGAVAARTAAVVEGMVADQRGLYRKWARSRAGLGPVRRPACHRGRDRDGAAARKW
jgi:pyruvate/2-oxoglutarate dehydrogenase complex dihydrolipoamide dehydrogenase (E3) component